MFVDFNKVFHPTFDEKEKMRRKRKDIHDKLVEKLRHMPLVPDDKTGILLFASPLMGFPWDCRYCKHYRESGYDFIDGGSCSLHDIHCGAGSVCRNVCLNYQVRETYNRKG